MGPVLDCAEPVVGVLGEGEPEVAVVGGDAMGLTPRGVAPACGSRVRTAHADNTPHTPAASTTRRVIGAHSPVQGPEAAGSDVGDVGEAFEECMVCAMVPGAYLPGPCS